ncbi:alpha/beta fold hydrolase [Microbacterium sp. R86528]|uniref:alpha/beta fold hydrolase n=1 Tax=Microbacterium sp. R86528 TaxID=3093864 RepID=UPI0037C92B3A
MTARQVTLRDGRSLGMSDLGDPVARRLVLLCHPSPGASEFDPDPLVTTQWGVRVIAPERPGYGASDPWRRDADASFARHADDISSYLHGVERQAAMLEGVDYGSIGVVGWGAGGLVALALAAQHPELVDRAVLVDTPAPEHFPDEVSADEPFTPSMLGISESEPSWTAASSRVERMLTLAARQGGAGVRGDQLAFDQRDWLARLDRVRAETLLVYGEDHPEVSTDIDGRWFRQRLLDARTVRAEGAGLAIATHWRKILAHVAPQHGDVPRSLRGRRRKARSATLTA